MTDQCVPVPLPGGVAFLTFDTGFDECWNCGGSATLGGSIDAIPNAYGGRYCSIECADEAEERRAAEDARKAALCVICDSPPGHCCTEYQDVDGSTVPWEHEYRPRG